jgi:hypothetical protein
MQDVARICAVRLCTLIFTVSTQGWAQPSADLRQISEIESLFPFRRMKLSFSMTRCPRKQSVMAIAVRAAH